ncbi:MAG: ATP-binding protein [Nanoarchaeota archaeon]|nr:ATP-binding protein [Nanoarchaeota archaeon]MBU1321887.1 ATP-binding protein [Nanoarchaeota archaeon]MBU1597662.1 ATP-binding protein [Nanoarchaeota archaeon]MBU2442225.1 ATP-binding protein [Nanoarchaeota archaeon]
MTELKKYVLTGGPSSGKSTLLYALQNKGFLIVEESAKEIIYQEKERGINEPWLDKTFPDFQNKIFELQLKKESEIPEDAGVVFFDRGVPDSLIYFEYRKFEPPQKLLDIVGKCGYEKVFLLEQLQTHEKNDYRVEDEEESKLISGLIRQTYEKLGYDVIVIPPVSVEERLKLILKHVENS